jgi:hypothetical protein
MFQNSLFPLRTIVGDSVPIGKVSSVRRVFESEESRKNGIKYNVSLKYSIAETIDDPQYLKYLPSLIVDRQTISPGEGMNRLPVPPSPLPFPDDAQVLSFFALSKKDSIPDISRKLSARFSIRLSQPHLIGGICFGGFPYLPYLHEKMIAAGENSSNFGLPREIRLTCSGKSSDEKDLSSLHEFLDAEISTTRQEIISHSGLQYLCIDPTLTDLLTVHFSDYPSILKEIKIDRRGNLTTQEKYGFIIPYFYIFEYQEKTRYRPTVSAGILGSTTISTHSASEDLLDTPGLTTNVNGNDLQDILKTKIDYKYIISNSGKDKYLDFTASSIFGQQRIYDSKKKGEGIFTECFISHKVKLREKVVLYIEQGEEYERCIAGLKTFLPFIPDISLIEDIEKFSALIQEIFPNNSINLSALIGNVPLTARARKELETVLRQQILQIPQEIDFCEKVGFKVYELDPVEGISPLKVELDGKYATLVAEQVIDKLSEIYLSLFLEGIRFIRPSNSRYFAIELTNLDDKDGQFVIKSLQLIQSAHVSVHPRAAKTQQIRTLNFRIVGPNLAEDYALLGDEGFNFSIERFVAGERKSVLFRANSLMDLLHTGAAKIFSNVRRRAVEFEMVENFREVKGQQDKYQVKKINQDDFTRVNFENRETDNENTSWRSIESGKDVSWPMSKGVPNFDQFENYSGVETRSRNEQVSSLLDLTFPVKFGWPTASPQLDHVI